MPAGFHQILNKRQGAIGAALVMVTVAALACSRLPFLTASSTEQAVVDLSRCGANPSSICLDSFGLDDNNRMLITLFVPAALAPGYYLKVEYGDVAADYPCQPAKDFPTTVVCTGDPITLGTSIRIEAYSADKNALLAQGLFVISALALSTPLIVTPAPGSTGIPVIGFPTATNALVSTPIKATPTRGSSYPNP